jgi:hypothetical protein
MTGMKDIVYKKKRLGRALLEQMTANARWN